MIKKIGTAAREGWSAFDMKVFLDLRPHQGRVAGDETVSDIGLGHRDGS
jgi:hypothetical protein